jgi:hypothetical protein
VVDVGSIIHIHIIIVAAAIIVVVIIVVIVVRVARATRCEILADFPAIEHGIIYTLAVGMGPENILTLLFGNPCANELNGTI